MTPEDLAARAEHDPEAGFTAIRVATLLSKSLQGDPDRKAFMQGEIAKLRDGVDEQALATGSRAAMPDPDALRFARLAIEAAAADPALRPALDAAMAEQAASRELIGTGIFEVGALISVVLLISKTEIYRDSDGKWRFHLHKLDDKVLTELLKLGSEALKRFG